jgi:hypothetical protein
MARSETKRALLGFTPAGPAIETAAASLMIWLGGHTGIAYAAAQSVSIGGTATGVVAKYQGGDPTQVAK